MLGRMVRAADMTGGKAFFHQNRSTPGARVQPRAVQQCASRCMSPSRNPTSQPRACRLTRYTWKPETANPALLLRRDNVSNAAAICHHVHVVMAARTRYTRNPYLDAASSAQRSSPYARREHVLSFAVGIRRSSLHGSSLLGGNTATNLLLCLRPPTCKLGVNRQREYDKTKS
jgi:hypothetical protein